MDTDETQIISSFLLVLLLVIDPGC